MIHVQSFKRTRSYPSIVLFHWGNPILAFPPVLLKNTAANLTALISGDIRRRGPQSHHCSSSWSRSSPTASRVIPAPGAHGPDRWSQYYYSPSRQGTLITERWNDLPRARSELMARQDIAQHHQEHCWGGRGDPSSKPITPTAQHPPTNCLSRVEICPPWFTLFVSCSTA